MNNLEQPRKIAIIGNGFDLAHGLRTSYKQFAEQYKDHEVIKKFHKCVELLGTENNLTDEQGNIRNIEWYSFEENMERLIVRHYQDIISKDDSLDESELNSLNDLFYNLEKLLSQYLRIEYNSKQIRRFENIQKVIDDSTLVISFNYTNTIKIYSSTYYYVHGSLEDDAYIILGFANGKLPCLCNGTFIKYLKDVRKEQLNYLRYLKSNGCLDIKHEMEQFSQHACSLFGGRGEYALEYKKEHSDEYDLSELSMMLKKYAIKNDFAPHKDAYDFSKVEEIMVMGHGLEADLYYLNELFQQSYNLKKIILYSYDGESDEEIDRKKKNIERLSGIKNIQVCNYGA